MLTKEEIKRRNKIYYEQNKHRVHRVWYENNKEKLREISKKYRQDNKEVLNIKAKEKRKENSFKISAANRAYYLANKDKRLLITLLKAMDSDNICLSITPDKNSCSLLPVVISSSVETDADEIGIVMPLKL